MYLNLTGLASFVALVTTTTLAHAELPPRVGFELGGGLQVGRIYCDSEGGFCDDFTKAAGANINASYFLTPTFGLTADAWAMSHRQDDFTFTHYVNTLGVKWRPAPSLTVQVGVGAAHATLDYDGLFQTRATSDDALAVMAGVALDVVRGRTWALAVEGRFGTGFYGEDRDADGEADIVGRNVGLGASFTIFGF